MGLGQTFEKAVEWLLSDEQRAAQVGKVLGHVQRGRQILSEGQDELLRVFQFAPRADYKRVGKQLSGLKRRLRELDERLETLVPPPASPHPHARGKKR
jgi:hypothetical protein